MFKNYLNKLFNLLSPKKYIIAFGGVLVFLIIIKLFNYSLSDHLSDASFEDYFNTNYKIFSVRIPKNLNFSGEKVPISNVKVHEAMEKELIKNTYWQSRSTVLHRRATQWFPMIEPILKKNNVPEDFKYIALVESQLSNVVSPQGATGFWQIIESTGKGYGLEITDEVDERYHVIKATETACKYFKEAYKQFNNWTLVAASYNLGMNGIQAQLNKQHVDNYFDLHLTPETAKYIYRILAMKEIISRPKVYGFMLRKRDIYRPVATKFITVDSSIKDLGEFANSQGITYTILKHFNPWLIANTLTIKSNTEGLDLKENAGTGRKRYVIEIPINTISIQYLNIIENDSLSRTDSIKSVSSAVIPDSTTKGRHSFKEERAN